LRQVDAPIAGVLMTQVDIDKIVSYGGDYYYQGYYDYYGYNNAGEGKKKNTRTRLTETDIQKIRLENSDYERDFQMFEKNGHGNAHGYKRQPEYATDGVDQAFVNGYAPTPTATNNGYESHPEDIPGDNENGSYQAAYRPHPTENADPTQHAQQNGYRESQHSGNNNRVRTQDSQRFTDDLDLI